MTDEQVAALRRVSGLEWVDGAGCFTNGGFQVVDGAWHGRPGEFAAIVTLSANGRAPADAFLALVEEVRKALVAVPRDPPVEDVVKLVTTMRDAYGTLAAERDELRERLVEFAHAGAERDRAAIAALTAERDRQAMALAAERGCTYDDEGEPYPWTEAGWWSHHKRWGGFDSRALVAENAWVVGPAVDGTCAGGQGTCAGMLDGMEQAMRAMGLEVPWLAK